MTAIAGDGGGQGGDKPNHREWAILDYWSVLQAALLLLDIDPRTFWTDDIATFLDRYEAPATREWATPYRFPWLRQGERPAPTWEEWSRQPHNNPSAGPPPDPVDSRDYDVQGMIARLEHACWASELAYSQPYTAAPGRLEVATLLPWIDLRPRLVVEWAVHDFAREAKRRPDVTPDYVPPLLLRHVTAYANADSRSSGEQINRWQAERLDSALAALAVVLQYPDECRDRRSRSKVQMSASAIADAVHRHADDFWPSGSPPHGHDALRRLVAEYVEAVRKRRR